MAALKKAANGYDYMEPMLESEWDVLPEPKQRRRRAVKERVEIVYEVHPEQVAKRRRAVYNCLMILICFVMLSLVIAGNAAISKINLENIEIQSNIDKLESQAEQLSVELAVKRDITNVAQAAESSLDMSFPSASQIRYVEFVQPEKTETQEPKAEEKGFFERVWETVKGLFS